MTCWALRKLISRFLHVNDLLTMSTRYDTDYEVNCVADPDKSDSSRPVGPCITSMLDLRDTKNPLEGLVVQDCAVPHAISHFLYPLLECSPTLGRPAPGGVDKLKRRLMKPLVSGSKLDRTAAYLVMSHDSRFSRQFATSR